MRAFIVLALVATASAALLPGGYNYGPGQSGTFQTVSGSIVGPGGYKLSGELVGSESRLIGSGVNAGIGSSRVVGNGLSVNGNTVSYSPDDSKGAGHILSSGGHVSSTGGTRLVGLHTLDSIPQTVEYSKQFYHFSAPEEHHNEGVNRQQLSNVLKKNLQVVFIKAPENNAAANAALQLAKQAIEQRTAIYVLSKENDASQTVAQLQQIQEIAQTAPEVKFIKYRTQQDIAHAKEVIQSQYDNFGGAAQNFDGGIAPVLNFASNVDGLGHGISHVNGGVGSSEVSAGSVKYVSGSTGSFGGLTGNVGYVSDGSKHVNTVESLGVLSGDAKDVAGSTGSLEGLKGGVNYVSGGSKNLGAVASLSGSKYVNTIGSLGGSAGDTHYVSGSTESLKGLNGGVSYVSGGSLGGLAGSSHFASGGSKHVDNIGSLGGSAESTRYVSGSTESLDALQGGINYVSGGSKHVGTILATSQDY